MEVRVILDVLFCTLFVRKKLIYRVKRARELGIICAEMSEISILT